MTLSDEIKALVSTLEMQLNGFAKAAYEKDLRIADLERQLAEASPPACLIEPIVMPQKVHVHHIAAIAKCSGIFGLVSMSEIQKFALALLNEFATAAPSAPAVERQPVAFVPIHPRNGPLWASTIPSLDRDYPANYELRPLMFADDAPQAADTDKVREVIPDGWQLVPTTPTTEMFRVGCEVHDQRPSEVREVYSAMLAAAPLPAAPVQQEGGL